jgi:hypothetical protein
VKEKLPFDVLEEWWFAGKEIALQRLRGWEYNRDWVGDQ